MTTLRYDIYNPEKLVVFGDKKQYHSVLKRIGARWSTKLQFNLGSGWLVPRNRQADLDKIILDDKLNDMERHARSRHDQRKYHRAVSASDEQHQRPKIASPEQEQVSSICKRYSRSPAHGPPPPTRSPVQPAVTPPNQPPARSPARSPVQPPAQPPARSPVKPLEPRSPSLSSSDSENDENLILNEVRKLSEQMKYMQRKIKKLSSKS